MHMVGNASGNRKGNPQHSVIDGLCFIKVPVKRFGITFWRMQGFQFTMGTWWIMSDYTQLAINEFQLLGDRYLPVLAYSAAKAYNFINGRKVSFTENDVERWIQKMPTEDAQKIINALMESKIGGESMSKLIEESDDEKKKFGLMTSKTMQSVT